MTFGFRSRSSRGGFRSPRGSRGSFRGRGRGSDSYFESSRGSSYSERPYQGSSYRGSNFRGRDDFYDNRNVGSKYSHDRYDSSYGRKNEDSYHHRDIREPASGSFYSRRNDAEPTRKKMRSEIGSYKEGASQRRSYDDLDHSNRSFNSNVSYHSESSSPYKSHKKEYSDFKKPLPMEHGYSERRPRSRGSRGRGAGISRPAIKTRPAAPAPLRRSAAGRISKMSSTTRLQQLLRRKKQIRIMRLRNAREERNRVPGAKHDETNAASSDEEMMTDNEDILDQLQDEEEEVEGAVTTPEAKNSPNENNKKEIKSSETEVPNTSESPKPKKNEDSSPVKVPRTAGEYIPLRCGQCKTVYRTFNIYQQHLRSWDHKTAMEKLLHKLKMKLVRMRTEQRKQQRIIDEQCDGFSKTSYCKLCKLNYKQTKQEHFTSDFHVNMKDFLKPRCNMCRLNFPTPILFEHHMCTLTHIKRKAFLEKEATKEKLDEDENNDEDNFMVLDSVGSADESNDELDESVGDGTNKEAGSETKTKAPKIVGSEFIKKVTCYYCKLCQLCINYKPNKNPEDLLLAHCRGRYHLKRYSFDKQKKEKDEEDTKTTEDKEIVSVDELGELEQSEKFWADEDGGDDDNHKISEDEEECGNRYDRFGHSDEKENVGKLSVEVDIDDDVSIKTEPDCEKPSE